MATVERNIDKRGLFIVLIGPDGSGKSTIAEHLLTRGRAEFKGVDHFHWRPGVLPQLKKKLKDTHANEVDNAPPRKFAYGKLISLIRFIYYLMDFIAGYWLRVYPGRKRCKLVLAERWYFDVIVNPERYGFDVPQWIRYSAKYFLPTPDITILLTGDPEVIHARKNELDPHAIMEQIDKLKRLLDGMPGLAIVPTDVAIEDSIEKIDAVIDEALY